MLAVPEGPEHEAAMNRADGCDTSFLVQPDEQGRYRPRVLDVRVARGHLQPGLPSASLDDQELIEHRTSPPPATRPAPHTPGRPSRSSRASRAGRHGPGALA